MFIVEQRYIKYLTFTFDLDLYLYNDAPRFCLRALILFIQTLALYKSFTYLLTYFCLDDISCYCSKARHGTVTIILMNLSVALTILLVVLYIAEQFADSSRGCRIANVFRYYLVLVSLFWNGIEAHNMYRMLVKVFNTGESHYVLKAAIVAWGRDQLRFIVSNIPFTR